MTLRGGGCTSLPRACNLERALVALIQAHFGEKARDMEMIEAACYLGEIEIQELIG
jgi:hypothetical protein